MSEKPILFSAPMVRAILNGRKSQTRRLIKPQPDCPYVGTDHWHDSPRGSDTLGPIRRIPYAPGEVMWVRETWMPCASIDSFLTDTNLYAYKADYVDGDTPGKWRPSIHMPKEAARLFLRVTDVRAERVQDIAFLDALDEGIKADFVPPDGWLEDDAIAIAGAMRAQNGAIDAFRALWDTLNAKRGYGWDANPWVFVHTFERISKNEAM